MATCFLISPPVGTLGVAVGDPNSIVVVCVGWELTVLPLALMQLTAASSEWRHIGVV
jgi:hypothetical protein